MKKIGLLFSIAVLLTLSISGCGNESKDLKGGTENKKVNAEVNSAMDDYLANLANLQEIEAEIYQSIEKEDGEEFDLAVEKIQKETELALENIKKISQGNQEVSFNFIAVARAKEKESIFYHMPVIKHFAKAYDQALENKKTDAYNYLKNEIDEVEMNNILKRNNIKSLNEFKGLENKKASGIINSEPELYKMVSWKKIATDVGKAGINAFVDAIKGDNPLSAKEIGKDYLIEKFKSSEKKNKSEIKIRKGVGTILGINKNFKDGIDSIIPYDESVEHIITNDEEEEIQKLLNELDEKIIFGRKAEAEQDQSVSLPAGDWSLTIGVPEKQSQSKEIKTEEASSVEINPADFGIGEFLSVEAEEEKDDVSFFEASGNIIGKWKAFNITGEYINSAEYMKAWADKIPDVEFFEGNKILYTFNDREGGLEGTYTFDGKTGQINLGTSPYMKLVLDGDELSSQSLIDTTSSNPTTYFYKRK